jgi:FlaA1/EpsC-like NDP-sugar epimerase
MRHVPKQRRTTGRQRALVRLAADSAAWAIAIWFATLARYDLNVSAVHPTRVLAVVPPAVAVQGIVGWVFGLYNGRWRLASFDEVAALTMSAALTAMLVFTANLWFDGPQLVPRSVPLAAGVTALVLMAAARYGWRRVDERRRRPAGDDCRRLLVFGAGEGGAQVVTAMQRHRDGRYIPVALLDDDTQKRNLTIAGVRVVGNRSVMAKAAADRRADTLLIAIPSAGAALVTELSEQATVCGLEVKVLPPVSELLGGIVRVGDIREVTVADLLGRHEVETDVAGIAGYVTGRRVLVTGAGGSIGSELCRQLHRYAPETLIMLDRDESALHAVQLSIEGRALLDSADLVLVDIRDRLAVEQALATHRPQVIFHSAALKHLPLLERHPAEAVKTNVWATLDLLQAAARSGVTRFVNISTDKAADPISVLGYTKRITERLASHVAERTGMHCLSVRFGNVLGSRGSVLTTFRDQIQNGGPLTVTHPDVTRFFMTVEEAVQLVIQAGAIGKPGEALVLDMGDPVRIADLARVLAARSDRPISIHFTGLRSGEKLHEVVLASGEADRRPMHPLISHVRVPPLDPDGVRAIDVTEPPPAITRQLAEMCGVQVAEVAVGE